MNTSTFTVLRTLFIFLVVYLLSTFLHAQNTDWFVQAKGISGSPLVPTVLNHLTKDAAGNIYLSSNVTDSTQLDSIIFTGFPVAPGTHLAAEYLAKLNPNGEVQWVQTFTGLGGFVIISDMVTDPAGNLYFVGKVINEVSIDTINISTNFSGGEMLLAKFNPAGEVQWVETSDSQPGFSEASGSSIALGPNGDLVISGFVESNVNFQGVSLEVGGNSRHFLASYDTTGVLNWVRPYGTSYPLFLNQEVGIDAQNNIYWVATSAGAGSNFTATFDTITISTEFGAMYLAKFNENGEVMWLNSYLGDSANFVPVTSGDLAMDPTGNGVVISGVFNGSLNIAGTTLTESSVLASDMFVAKFDPEGNGVWAKQSHGVAEPVKVYDMSANDQGDVFIAMRVFNSMGLTPFTLGEGTNEASLTLDATTNGVLAKYASNGDLDWMKAMFGPGESEFHAVVATGPNSAAVSGYFTATASLGDSTVIATPQSFSSNVFVAICNGDASATGIFQVDILDINVNIYPNPSRARVHIELEDRSEVERIQLTSLQGQLLKDIVHPRSTESIDLSTLPKGIYLLRFSGGKGIVSKKLVIH